MTPPVTPPAPPTATSNLRPRPAPARAPLAAMLLVLAHAFPVAMAASEEGGKGTALGPALKTFQLRDQFGTNHHQAFPRSRPLLLLVGDRKGVEEVDAWLEPLKERWGTTTDIVGIADVRAVPRFLRDRITGAIAKARPKPVMLDFDGTVLDGLTCARRTANLFVVHSNGTLVATVTGLPTPERLGAIDAALRPFLGTSAIKPAP